MRAAFPRLGVFSVLLLCLAPALIAQAESAPRYFPETQHILKSGFLDYWAGHGQLAQQGYPLTEEFAETSTLDGKTYNVQYFERAVFEYHPENAGTPYTTLLSQLGTFRYKAKYGAAGAPGQVRNPNTPRTFPETGHSVGGGFLAYWEQHGGLAQQGYPISDEFTEISDQNGKPYTVQYFERAVFEYHPENAGSPFEVLLAQLGKFQVDARYPNKSLQAALPVPAPVAQVPPTSVAQPTAVAVGHMNVTQFAAYLRRKYNKLGARPLAWDLTNAEDIQGTHSIDLYMDTNTAGALMGHATQAEGQQWGEAVLADAQANWPTEDFTISLGWSLYSTNICTGDCITTCYYQSTDYTSGRGWFTTHTFVDVSKTSGVILCPMLR